MKIPFSCFCLFVVAAVLSGCGTPGFPRQSYDPKKQIKQVEKEFAKPELITQYFALTNAPEETKRAARDKIITGRITLINLNYNQFVAQFSVKKESLDFGTEVTELGLNLATTAAGGAETKTILGAVASGVTGSKLAVDKNFFFEKTVPVLITSMNAQRKEALLPILTGMNNNTDQYPLTQALSDLDAYYFAGTFIGALQAIQADAGSKDVQAQKNLNAVRTTKFTNDNSGILLQSYWTPKVSGTVATTTGSSSVAGIGTQFTKEIAVGDQIAVGQDMASVKTIADDAHLTAGANFTTNTNGAAYQIFSAKHQKAIEDWLSKNGMPDIAIQELINGDLFSDARKKAVQDLKIQPQQ